MASARAESARGPSAQEGHLPAKPEDAPKDDRRAELAARVHRLRAKHPDPAIRTSAHLHLAALEPDAESAARMLHEALGKDPDIAGDAMLVRQLAERTAETRKAGHSIGREAVLATFDDRQLRDEAHEATSRRPPQPKGSEAGRRKKQDPNTPGER